MAPEQAAIQTRRKEREDVVELLSLVYVSSACVCLRCCLSSYLPSRFFFFHSMTISKLPSSILPLTSFSLRDSQRLLLFLCFPLQIIIQP